MAVLTKKQIRCVGTISGNQPSVRVYSLHSTAGELFGGDLVAKQAAANEDIIRSATPVAANDLLLGMLMHGALFGTEWFLNDPVDINTRGGGTFGGTFAGGPSDLLGTREGIGGHVVLANDDNIFEISMVEALSALATGQTIQVQRDTTGDDANVWEGTEAGATKSALIVAKPNIPGQVPVDTFGRVWIQFLGTASALY